MKLHVYSTFDVKLVWVCALMFQSSPRHIRTTDHINCHDVFNVAAQYT